MFHPLPPKLGPGVFLGAVERTASFVTDNLWYGVFAGVNPGESMSLSVSVISDDQELVHYTTDVTCFFFFCCDFLGARPHSVVM